MTVRPHDLSGERGGRNEVSSRATLRRWVVILAALLVSLPAVVAAHPFGSQFFAQQTILKLEPDHIDLEYVIEIPTTIIMREFYEALEGRNPSREEDARYTRDKVETLLKGLRLFVDGRPVSWQNTTDMARKNGVGNMNFFVYRVYGRAAWSPAAGSFHQIRLENDNYPDLGTYYNSQIWTSDAVEVKKSSLWGIKGGEAAVDYAGQWYQNPALRDFSLDVRVVSRTGGAPVLVKSPEASAASSAAGAGGLEGEGSLYVPMVEGVPLQEYLRAANLGPWLILVALGMALFLGAAHALSPGHGKTLVAAYLVGSRGTVKHAVLLGLVVTAAHTSSVIVLGLVILFAQDFIMPEKLYPVVGALSGLMIVGIGVWMLRDRWRLRGRSLVSRVESLAGGGEAHHFLHYDDERPANGAHLAVPAGSGLYAVNAHRVHAHDHMPGHSHDHTHPPGHSHDHTHPPGHSHDHTHPPGHSHSHGGGLHHHWGGEHEHSHDLPPDASVGQLIRLGIAGGLVPCPSATVVLLTAIALHRVAFGLALVVAFSVGLAGVLVAIGVVVVMAGAWLKRFEGRGRVARYLPVASAVVVTILGLVITADALFGVSSPLRPPVP